MTTGIILAAIIIVLALVTTVGLGIARPGTALGARLGNGLGTGTGALRRRFGPEYERVLARHNGDTAATRDELRERLRTHGQIKLRPLTWQERERYAAEWTGLQERFVDSPATAVADARGLLERLVQDRGYPDAESGQQIDALSVHRPRHVQTYRDVREVTDAGGPDSENPGSKDPGSSTEELRTVLVRARGLFEELVKPGPQDPDPGHGSKGKSRTGRRINLLSRSN
jgi:hypothetical protein